MIELPTKFAAENAKGSSTPSILVKLGGSVLENIQSSAGDWGVNTAETNVDYVTEPGNVRLVDQSYTDTISQTTNNASIELLHSVVGDPEERNEVRQSFINAVPGTELLLESITIRIASYAVGHYGGWPDGTNNIGIYIRDSSLNIIKFLSVSDNNATPHDLTINFLSYDIKIPYNETYYFELYATQSDIFYPYDHYVTLYYSSSGGYSNGFLDVIYSYKGDYSGNIGDAVFSIKFAGAYYPLTGSITTQIIDLSEVPTGDGTFKVQSIKPSHYGTTNIIITAYGSTDGFSSSNENLGTVVDGQILGLSDIYRYYKFKADFTTTSSLETPDLLSVGVSFVIFSKFSDNTFLGYPADLKSVSSLTTEISDTAITTIGQITLTFGQTTGVASFLTDSVPKNKIAQIKLGFIADGFTEDDYIEYYTGVVADWSYEEYDINIIIKDNSASWKIEIPRETSSAGNHVAPGYDNVIASGDHPIDIIKDILYNHIITSESAVDTESLDAAKTALSGWLMTRTISGSERQAADSILNEIRILIGGYFLFKSNGRVSLKLYDSDETVVASFSHDDFIQRPSWESNIAALINKTLVEYDWNTGTEVYDHVFVGIDDNSQTDYGQIGEYDFSDKWTDGDAQGIIQQTAFTTRILTRYAYPPSIFRARVDRRWIALEVADMVNITTNQYPSADLSQVTKKFQIIKRNFNPQRAYIDFTFLEVP